MPGYGNSRAAFRQPSTFVINDAGRLPMTLRILACETVKRLVQTTAEVRFSPDWLPSAVVTSMSNCVGSPARLMFPVISATIVFVSR